jgi:hypothetical protein
MNGEYVVFPKAIFSMDRKLIDGIKIIYISLHYNHPYPLLLLDE